MEVRQSSGEAALATAIPAAALAGLDFIKDHYGGGERRGGGGHHGGGHHGERYVTEREMCLIRENGEQGNEIAKLKSEKYTDAKIEKLCDKLTAKIERVEEKAEAANNFLNEKFSKGYNELASKYGELNSALTMEVERRKCGDKEILCYVDGNFVKAKKYIDGRDIKACGCELSCNCNCRKGEGGGKGSLIADLIAEGSVNGTLTFGAATITTPPSIG